MREASASRWRVMIGVGALACAALTARAEPAAYWRFEEGPEGGQLSGGSGQPGEFVTKAADETGANPLRTFQSPFGGPNSVNTSPTYSRSVSAPRVGPGGPANNFSLQFNAGGDGNDDIYSENDPINSRDFTAFTLEASFNVFDVNRFHGLIGKDGSPVAGNPLSALQLKVRDDTDNLQIEILDGNGNAAQVQSLSPIVPGRWYHAAAVNDGSVLSLYLDDTTDADGFILQGSVGLNGGGDGMFDGDGNFTVGRGFFNGNITDWTNGLIDEVRISDDALSPSQFLFAPVPEPASLAVLLLGGGLLTHRRRRR